MDPNLSNAVLLCVCVHMDLHAIICTPVINVHRFSSLLRGKGYPIYRGFIAKVYRVT